MNNEDIQSSAEDATFDAPQEKRQKRDLLLPASILLSALILAGTWIYSLGFNTGNRLKVQSGENTNQVSGLEAKVLPKAGFELPVKWGDLGTKMVGAGVIDKTQFEGIYAARGGLTGEEKQLLSGNGNGNLKITEENSGVLLNLLWAFGLSNKNEILTKGPMMTYSGAASPADSAFVATSAKKAALAKAGNLASTGGWTIAVGSPMSHYGAHPFVTLTPAEQSLVENVSKGIYRPCCGNSVYFPDCNHGMAMLGLLELMASQGVSEDEMYRVALEVNSFWFPDNYLTIARYLESKGISWDKADPKQILGINFSSARGYQQILSQTPSPQNNGSGSGCGIDAAPAPRSGSGCGV